MDKEIKKQCAKMVGSEDQLLASMSGFLTSELLETYDSICAQVDHFPQPEDANLARILLALGFGRLVHAEAERNRMANQPPESEKEGN